MTAKSRWLVVALVVSVTLNVFIFGIVLGHKLGSGPLLLKGFDPHVTFNMKRISQHLTDQERNRVRSVLQGQRKELRARYIAIRGNQKRIRDLLAAENVDKGALAIALESQAGLVQEMSAPMRAVLMEVIADLDYETRVKVVDDFFKARHMRPGVRPVFPGQRRNGPPHRRNGKYPEQRERGNGN